VARVYRMRQRGTPTHSTVTVAGKNSSEVWAGFRVARRARVHKIRVNLGVITACHDGYRRLEQPGDRHRAWTLDDTA
jgi:hypothetical protein